MRIVKSASHNQKLYRRVMVRCGTSWYKVQHLNYSKLAWICPTLTLTPLVL